MRTVKRWLRIVICYMVLVVSWLVLLIEGPSGPLGYICVALAFVVSVLCKMFYDYYEEMVVEYGARGEKYGVVDLLTDGLLLCARTQKRMVPPELIHPREYTAGEDVTCVTPGVRRKGSRAVEPSARFARSGRRHS